MPLHPAAPEDLDGLVAAYQQTTQSLVDLGHTCSHADFDLPDGPPGLDGQGPDRARRRPVVAAPPRAVAAPDRHSSREFSSAPSSCATRRIQWSELETVAARDRAVRAPASRSTPFEALGSGPEQDVRQDPGLWTQRPGLRQALAP